MIDLTKNTTPFGLLDEESKEALKAHKGTVLRWRPSANSWLPYADGGGCRWYAHDVYRIEPKKVCPKKVERLVEDIESTLEEVYLQLSKGYERKYRLGISRDAFMRELHYQKACTLDWLTNKLRKVLKEYKS